MASTSPTRLRHTRRVLYAEDSDNDLDYAPSRDDRPSRSQRRPQSYREASDESSLEEPLVSRPEPGRRSSLIRTRFAQQATLPSKPKRRRPTKRKYATRSAKDSISAPWKKRKPNPLNLLQPEKAIAFPLPPSGKIPQWQNLPYEALIIILRHAAYPFYEDRGRSTGSVEWLCAIGRLSRSFQDAATGALLAAPPLYPLWRAKSFLALLRQNEKPRNRIKRLDIEVSELLVGKNAIDLLDLLDCVPNLEQIRLFNNDDNAARFSWSQFIMKKKKWTYPVELFDKFDEANVRLKAFEWNGRLSSPIEVLRIMSAAHTRACFSQIESLTLLNFSFEDKSPELPMAQQLFSTSITALPNLKSLSILSCTLLDEVTTPLLPPTLTSLEIAYNITFLAEYLSAFLISHGAHLTSLTLKHNQSMSLDFLTYLAHWTPRLRHLTLDLSYSDPSAYNEVHPLFEDALPSGSPTWPASLVSIAIKELRQINLSEAEQFFQSLVDMAPQFDSLRHVSIKAIIRDGSWRERAALRNKWISKIERVFLDTSPPRNIASPPALRPQISSSDAATATSDSDAKTSSQGRRSGRLREAVLDRQSQNEDLLRTASRRQLEQRSEADISDGGEGFIHGRCSVVAISMSDQRPAETQLTEKDFLDDEPSDDEDYRDG
ncbi:uncharacterized protein AB675_9981 [Cyphellophora attinorum]|uniref:Uncharacterized protein n=1 Tax=Cyphellophora attinorum TaxID=1664694 RepID=A0A0N0NJJ5_9EURO|nr:uncharacterized protein AB675_9981 [Phialophora attinorum]KPI36719.1 hypothetical protein AB675_9981 [Phialophora attinorum]